MGYGIVGHDYDKKCSALLKWIHRKMIDLVLVFISFCSNQLSLIFLWAHYNRSLYEIEPLLRTEITNSFRARYLAPENLKMLV